MLPFARLAFVLLPSIFLGCSSQPETVTVSGKVYATHPTTGKKVLVRYGRVTFHNIAHDKYRETRIQSDGSYTVTDALLGPTNVSVTSEHPLRWQGDDIPIEQRPKRPSDDVVRKWFPINAVYNSFAESPLEMDVQKGKNADLYLKMPYKRKFE